MGYLKHRTTVGPCLRFILLCHEFAVLIMIVDISVTCVFPESFAYREHSGSYAIGREPATCKFKGRILFRSVLIQMLS